MEKQCAPRGNCDMNAKMSRLLEKPFFPFVNRRHKQGITSMVHPMHEVINVLLAWSGHRKRVLIVSMRRRGKIGRS